MTREDIAKHRAPRERRSRGPLILGVAVVTATALGAGAAWFLGGDEDGSTEASGCSGPSISVAAAPDIAPVVTEAVDSGGCDQVTVEAMNPAVVSAMVATGKGAPDVWIPDSSAWTARAATAAPTTPQNLVDSIATSPVVLVSASGEAPATWVEALSSKALVPGDPMTSLVAASPLVAAAAEAEASGVDLAATIVPLAQSQSGISSKAPDDVTRLADLAANGAGLTAATEQGQLAHAAEFKAAVPASGTLMLDYPVVLTADGARRAAIDETTRSLATLLAGSDTAAALKTAGFRAPDGQPVEGGVGEVTVMQPEADQVNFAVQQWATLVMPTRALAVMDVSGSMDFDAGGVTRMQLTTAVTSEGLTLFPDAAAIGLWAFSEKLAGNSDYRELLPIRVLGSSVDGRTQRDALLGGLRSLSGMTGGGTGLYDTTLAAYKQVQKEYDPDASNVVLLVTDGANDDPGSISQAKLLEELRRLADPTRPIRIIAIGITGDADAKALRTVARATGGDAFIAEDPADMPEVFAQASMLDVTG